MSYDWTTHKPDGHVDRSINFGSGTLHYLLEAMRDRQLLDEQTPMPDWPDEEAPEYDEQWRALSATRSPNPLQIPACKLRDQNGWLIRTEECYLLVHRLGRVQEPHVKRLVDFARYAVSKGGFTVS